MRRVKSRQRTFFMLIVFMLVFFTGAVFAFASNGGLIFTGAATVSFNNSPRLSISYNGHIVYASQSNAAHTAVLVPRPGSDGRVSVIYNTTFVTPGRVVYSFQIENPSAVCAIIRRVDNEVLAALPAPDWGITIGILNNLQDKVIPAGASESFSIEVIWNLPEDAWDAYVWVNNFGGLLGEFSNHSFTTTLHYEMYLRS